MKNNSIGNPIVAYRRVFFSKVFLIMRWTVLIMLIACLQVSAGVEAQQITYSKKKSSLEKVFKEIRKQTGYEFLYNNTMVKKARLDDIDFNHTPLKKALNDIFSDQPLTYTIIGKTIVVRRKEKHALSQLFLTDVHGTVVDSASGEPLVGVTIKVKGSTKGTTTDANGEFNLKELPEDAVLEVSYLGYKAQTVSVKGNSNLKISLAATATGLNQLVVVGYGTQRKSTLANAVSSISGDEVVTTKNENIENSLTGKIAGLRIVQNSSEPGAFDNSIDIRGMGAPLIVIDGVPRDNITRLNPNDIESVSVLKDASAAVYGVRAANGVILITTKKGKKGKLNLNYSGTFTWQVPSGLLHTVDAIDYMTL